MAEAFFAKLPPKLTASETELRDYLLKAAAAAERLLPRGSFVAGTVALQEWVDRRIPGQVVLATSEEGWVTLASGAAPAAERRGGVPAADQAAQAAEAFFSRLPHDSFSQAEDALRSALKTLLTDRGPQPASKAAADPGVASAAKAFLIRAVPLADWVERRIGGEAQVVLDEKGVRVIQLAKHEKEARIEAFFSGLPEGRFSREEEALRSAIIDFLASWKSKELATLSHAGGDKAVQRAKVDLFGAVVKGQEGSPPVTMREWIERRVGAELELHKDAKGQYAIHVTAASRHVVAARFQELERMAKGGKGKDKGFEAKGAIKGAFSPVGSVAQGKGGAKGIGNDKGKGAAKAAIAHEAAPVTKAEQEAIRKKFFDSLPEDQLEPPELELRQALLDFMGSWSGPAGQQHPFLTDLDKDRAVQDRKTALLPPGVSLLAWITTRIGGELATRREKDTGQVALILRDELDASIGEEATEEDDEIAREAKKEADWAAREEKREAFFAALPEDGFSPEEQAMREALMHYVSSTRDARPSLSGAGSDQGVRDARAGVVPKGCGVSLREWIDRRIGGEIETFEVGREVCIARKKSAEKRDKVDKASIQEAFFDALPVDGFTPEEDAMREALLNFIQSFNSANGVPPTLSNAGADAQVRDARAALLPKNNAPGLKDWIERRIGLEVETITQENNVIYMGLRGELEAQVQALPRQVVKRKAPDDKGKGSKDKGGGKGKDAKGRSKGKDDRAIIGAPAKRQRI